MSTSAFDTTRYLPVNVVIMACLYTSITVSAGDSYSSDSQTEQSIEGQLRVCNEYAKSNDIVILDTYIDRAMTGTNDNRPDFQRMIKDSAKKSFDVVLVKT